MDPTRKAAEDLKCIQERRCGIRIEAKMQFAVRSRCNIFQHAFMQAIRGTGICKRIEHRQSGDTIERDLENTAGLSSAEKVALAVIGFGEIEVQFVRALPQRNIVLKLTGSMCF